MGVITSWSVEILCDGSSQDCPSNSKFSTEVHVSASLRLAGRAGWELTDLTLCPACSSSGPGSPFTAPTFRTGGGRLAA